MRTQSPRHEERAPSPEELHRLCERTRSRSIYFMRALPNRAFGKKVHCLFKNFLGELLLFWVRRLRTCFQVTNKLCLFNPISSGPLTSFRRTGVTNIKVWDITEISKAKVSTPSYAACLCFVTLATLFEFNVSP